MNLLVGNGSAGSNTNRQPGDFGGRLDPGVGAPCQSSSQTARLGALAQRYRYTMHGSKLSGAPYTQTYLSPQQTRAGALHRNLTC